MALLAPSVALWLPIGWTFDLYIVELSASMVMWMPHVSIGLAHVQHGSNSTPRMKWLLSAAQRWSEIRPRGGLAALVPGFQQWAGEQDNAGCSSASSPDLEMGEETPVHSPAETAAMEELQDTLPGAPAGSQAAQVGDSPVAAVDDASVASVGAADHAAGFATAQDEFEKEFSAALGAADFGRHSLIRL